MKENIKHIWTVLSQGSSADSETKLLSIFNCLEALTVEADKSKILPGSKLAIPILFQVISYWSLEDQNKENHLEVLIEFVGPEGKILHKFEKGYDIKKGSRRFRNTVNFRIFPVSGSGRHIVRIKKKISNNNFEVVAEVPVDLDVTYKSLEGKSDKELAKKLLESTKH